MTNVETTMVTCTLITGRKRPGLKTPERLRRESAYGGERAGLTARERLRLYGTRLRTYGAGLLGIQYVLCRRHIAVSCKL